MKLHQNIDLFKQAVNFTAAQKGILDIYIEKDYWVTFVLYNLYKSELGKEIVFKGGTALSKCYNIIDRFSEDIDLIILKNDNQSDYYLKKKLKEITTAVSQLFPEIEEKDITHRIGMVRKTAHTYLKAFKGEFGQVRNTIIVEATRLGHHEPYETKKVASYIYEMMLSTNQQKLAIAYDLLPFNVLALDVKRTLCEKIMSLVRFSYTENPIEDLNNKIRHTYDCKSSAKSGLIFTTILLTLFLLSCSKKHKRSYPNIVLILADDTGADVFDAYGGTSYNTPNIDALVKTGLKFNQCYSAPVCSPSRVKLLTGRYGFRTGQIWGTIPANEITFAHQLKKAGYKTAISGKWQLAMLKDDPKHIQKMGFDESCVFGWHEGPRYYKPMIYQNGKVRYDLMDYYGPDVYTDFLIDFIKRNKHNPFFAYYSMTLAHTISNDLKTPPPVGKLGRYETFKENVEYADIYVGKIIKALNNLKLRENTIIIFVGDNGTPHHYITEFKKGKYIEVPVYSKVGDTLLQGGKSYLTDQGTHVPLIINWKGKTPLGKSINDLIDFSDFMNTIVELTGAELPNDRIIDGQSFAPQIIEKKGNPRNWIYQEWEGKGWIRNQNWKLYINDTLFNMKNDPFEKNPITDHNSTEESIKIKSYLSEELSKLKERK